jgi:digeranylgeranylglycerophospholipid reductase
MKIAIIGAGPGGLYAALAAAGRGLHVELWEKGRVGDRIVCGECIFDSLGIMAEPGRGLLYPVTDIVLHACRTHELHIGRYRRLWMMDRKVWQRNLAERAVACGVAIHEGVRVTPARLQEMEGAFDGIIDASGAPSVTSRLYGFSREYRQQGMLAYQVVLQGDFSALYPRIKAGFFRELPPEVLPAYYWVFPRHAAVANVGIGCCLGKDGVSAIDLKTLLQEVFKREGLEGMTVLRRGGGLVPSRILSRLWYGKILLAGDAAGLASPLHGGGIDLACLSGILAVDAIMTGKAGVERYRERLAGCLRERTAMEMLTAEKMRTLPFQAFDDILHAAASRGAVIRTKVGLRHADLLLAAWKWLRKKQGSLPPWP